MTPRELRRLSHLLRMGATDRRLPQKDATQMLRLANRWSAQAARQGIVREVGA